MPYKIHCPILFLVFSIAIYIVDSNLLEKNSDDSRYKWVRSESIFKNVKPTYVIPENVVIPLIRCPEVFHYRFANEFGGFFGVITIQKPLDIEKIEVQLNMSLERTLDSTNNLKMILLTDQEDIPTTDIISWAVIFPYQDLLPDLVSVQCNNRIICRNNVNLGNPGNTLFKLSIRAELDMNQLVNNSDEAEMKVRKKKRVLTINSKNKYSNYMNNNVNVLLPGYGYPPI
ncbi:uncharacterized protein [Onthophagus taurus]|uniref:uncharacterized protein n=1 Tax=Onthophagus taurus TaxID=166361 RepID=UPI0039BEAA39